LTVIGSALALGTTRVAYSTGMIHKDFCIG